MTSQLAEGVAPSRWVDAPRSNNRVPPALTAFAPGNTARVAIGVGTLERCTQSAERADKDAQNRMEAVPKRRSSWLC